MLKMQKNAEEMHYMHFSSDTDSDSERSLEYRLFSNKIGKPIITIIQ